VCVILELARSSRIWLTTVVTFLFDRESGSTVAKSGTKSACTAVEALRTKLLLRRSFLGIMLVGQKIDNSSYILIVTLLSYLVGV
jgi:hypothetical protein